MEGVCWQQGQLRGRAQDLLPQTDKRNGFKEESDYLISVVTKLRINYAFTLYQQWLPPYKKMFFPEQSQERSD